MDIDQIRTQLELFTVCSVESRPGVAALTLLVAVAATAWTTTVMVRRMIASALALAQAMVAAVANLSIVLAACLVLAVLALTG
ncbi:hypothetical protein [Virgisporangium aurantiacum]|uniref:Uncharacterized protein n=1 Tax=Virgisporangium aurantiacum TaxID=175570 RepID=A0A8J4E047_9ACTN|nr:hypothetical protein [Virgisporangium aurantiacum]GIJ54657.1 hypothetical protein Vau01_021730 [Virgisporangium aurantiacum]